MVFGFLLSMLALEATCLTFSIIGYVWLIPESLVGLALGLVSGARKVRLAGGAVEFIGCKRLPFGNAYDGRTIGWTICYKGNADVFPRLVRHERHHVRQGLHLGPFHVPAYLIGSLVAWARGGHYYRDNYLERAARRASGEE